MYNFSFITCKNNDTTTWYWCDKSELIKYYRDKAFIAGLVPIVLAPQIGMEVGILSYVLREFYTDLRNNIDKYLKYSRIKFTMSFKATTKKGSKYCWISYYGGKKEWKKVYYHYLTITDFKYKVTKYK